VQENDMIAVSTTTKLRHNK